MRSKILMILQRLTKIQQRLTKKEKRTILVGALIAVIISLMLIAPPLIDKRREFKDQIEAKEMLLERYKKVIAEKGEAARELDSLQEKFKGVEGMLLDGETPTLASVKLQNIIEKTAKKRKVQIKRVKTLKSKDKGDYQKVFVEISFSSDIASLVGLLYDVENNHKALSVSEIHMSFRKNRGGAALETILKVEGAFRNADVDKERKLKTSESEYVKGESLG